ncbi:DMT family transporter [Sinomonas sp. ASV322]|uniref:DMT family transporter n=1 Tax=Sinomonas sp. ASV322 TaxID=3041920 RepID=UPI0027DBF257|nr:DMT family transporter [Sinomonas sp. ASV322]MDQ4502529.1 DMT family transporter [Sinomonas sp. ASV322]
MDARIGRTTARGAVAMLLTVAVWAGFALSVRGIGSSTLTSADVALLRFAVPILVLAPWLPRTVRALRGENPRTLAAIAAGAGAPFLLLASLGGSMTSAALVGLVIPGSVPLFVSAISAVVWRDRLARTQVIAVVVIVAGVGIAAAGSASSVSAGIGVLLAAGLLWSIYTLGLRRTSLDPVSAALVLCVPSAVAVAAGIALGWLPSRLAAGTAAAGDVVEFVVVQGLGVGVVAGLCYAVAVRSLGPRPAAAFGALSPVATALAAVPLFGELPGSAAIAALVTIVAGVLAFTLLAPRPRPTPSPAAEPHPPHAVVRSEAHEKAL